MRKPTLPRLAFLLLFFSLLLPACSAGSDRTATVVVTTNILGDVTRAVVGDAAEVVVLMEPGADPHSFGLSARQAATVENAALVVHNGLGLEEGVARNVAAAADAGVPTLAVGEGVDPLDYTADESAGQPDPHFWTDPRRMSTAVELIAAEITERVEGVDGTAIEANTTAYLAELRELDGWMTERFAAIPEDGRKLVTNHHVFGYLADRYGFTVIGAVVPSGTTLASPSAADLASLATAVEEAGVRAVFADSSQPDRLARALAEEAGLEVAVIPLYSESLTAPGEGAGTYLEMMRANTDALVDGLAAPQAP